MKTEVKKKTISYNTPVQQTLGSLYNSALNIPADMRMGDFLKNSGYPSLAEMLR